jgi:hypothetical protein
MFSVEPFEVGIHLIRLDVVVGGKEPQIEASLDFHAHSFPRFFK